MEQKISRRLPSLHFILLQFQVLRNAFDGYIIYAELLRLMSFESKAQRMEHCRSLCGIKYLM